MSQNDVKPNAEYKVKIFGCIRKEITVKQQKIRVKEISILAGLSQDTLYKVDGSIIDPQTEITLRDGIELECGDLATQVEDVTVQYMTELSHLGFCVEKFDEANILIKNYPLPPGWNKKTTDLILHVPPDITTTIHGIIIPRDLVPADGGAFPVNQAPDEYVSGRTLLSFRLRQDLHNNHHLQNHMELVHRVLAFKTPGK